MDIFEQARRSVNRSLIENYFSTEKSKWVKNEFWTLNPLRQDSHENTFSISETGLYNDLGYEGQYTGDFIKLVSEVNRISLKEAAEKIINDSGGIIPENEYKKKQEKKPDFKGIKIDKIIEEDRKEEFINRIKSDYNTKDKDDNIWKPVASYKYREYKTKLLLFYIIRYESEIDDKIQKKFSPFCLDENSNIKQKLPKNFSPYPLYNINSILDNDYPVIIVEGEKCADIEIIGYNIVTFLNGAGNLSKSDFTPLNNRKIFIFPDNDEPGKKAADKIRHNYLPQANILNLEKLEKPEKWDLADAAKEGLNLEELIEFLIEDTKEDLYIDSDPEYAADLFLKERYNNYNLNQLDGVFWRYLEKKHYWERIDYSNIKSDIQIFLREKGFFSYLGNIDKSKTHFKNQVASFIQDHSLGYFKGNPFIDSAVAPYIHIKNGVIEITDSGFNFISRSEKKEDYFRKLYPVNCFDFEYDKENEGKVNYLNLKKYAPTFHYYVKSIIPQNTELQKENFQEELFMTLKFVCQMIAYCMSPMKKRPYFFSFYGAEDTAKSSLFYLVREFIGEQFTINRSIADMESSRFSTSDLWGAKLFVDEDMQENTMIPAAFIKKYSGNQSITIERKRENAQHGVKVSVAMFFVSNYKLKAYGIEGLKRRAIIAKFENKVPKKPDSDLMKRISGKKPHNELTPEYEGKTFDERSFILHLIMQEWEEMSQNGYRIVTPSWIIKSTDELLSEMTSGSEYLKDAAAGYRESVTPGIKYSIDEFFKDYKDWCSDEGRKPRGKDRFEEEIKRDLERLEPSRTSNRRKGVYKLLKKDYDEDNETLDSQESIPFEGE